MLYVCVRHCEDINIFQILKTHEGPLKHTIHDVKLRCCKISKNKDQKSNLILPASSGSEQLLDVKDLQNIKNLHILEEKYIFFIEITLF